MWLDASIRFTTWNISHIFNRISQNGIYTSKNSGRMIERIYSSMFGYFRADPICLYSPFFEIEANFVVMKNDIFNQVAVVGPWVSCAFSPDCVCPINTDNNFDCLKYLTCSSKPRDNGFFHCHRYDQAALGMILTTLFQLKSSSIGNPAHNIYRIMRGDNVRYFP